MSYCPLFWGFVEIYKAHDTQYILRETMKKLIIFAFMAIFLSYRPQFCGSGVIKKAHDTQ
jgi:hypothetical protein